MIEETKHWTVGRGIAVGLKWIAIMGIVITIFAFLQFYIKFQAGYYEKEFRDFSIPRPLEAQPSQGNCEIDYGSTSYWDEELGGCVVPELVLSTDPGEKGK